VTFRDLELAPDLDPWEQQPHESNAAHAKFRLYLNQPPSKRSARKVAESVQKSLQVINRQRVAHLWDERVRAYDADQQLRHQHEIEERVVKLATTQIAVSSAMLSVVAGSVAAIGRGEQPKLAPLVATRWVDASIKLSKAARDVPELRLQLVAEHEHSGTLDLQIPELDGLTDEEARERVGDMLTSVARLDEYRSRAG
jgi:hypothetical protein